MKATLCIAIDIVEPAQVAQAVGSGLQHHALDVGAGPITLSEVLNYLSCAFDLPVATATLRCSPHGRAWIVADPPRTGWVVETTHGGTAWAVRTAREDDTIDTIHHTRASACAQAKQLASEDQCEWYDMTLG